jgi:hypothetical protein
VSAAANRSALRPAVAAAGLVLAAACGTTVGGSVQAGSLGDLPGGSTLAGRPAVPLVERTASPLPDVAQRVDGMVASPTAQQTAVRDLPTAPHQPVEVGFYVAKNGDAYYSSLGLKGVSTGDSVGMANAVVADVNAHGGLAGHRVVPVFFTEDPTSTQTVATQEQAACDTWTQDHHVVAVVTPLNTGDTLEGCLTARHVAQVLTSFTVLTAAGLQRYPLLASPTAALEDVDANTYVESLAGRDWFRPISATRPLKIGLVEFDVPERKGITDRVVVPALARHGLRLAERRAVSTPASGSDLGRTAAEVQSAVLRFNAVGVTHVLFMDQAGGLAFLFGLAAHSNQYFPRYGYTSNSAPLLLQANLQPEDLVGSMGVGWHPLIDVDDAHQPPPSSSATRCVRLMRGARVDVSDQTVRDLALAYCDGLFLLQQARSAAPEGSFGTGLERLGIGFGSAGTFSSDFRGGRRAGAAQVRDFAYDDVCRCFRYTGPIRRMAS